MHRSIHRILLGTAVLGVLMAPTTGMAQSSSGSSMAQPGSSSPPPSAMTNQPDPALDKLDKDVRNALRQCQQISHSCDSFTKTATGILVFPDIVKANFLVGGAGGKGALIEKGKITGYYKIGAASIGLQAGIESSSQVFIFRTPEALAELKSGSTWKAGARGGATLVSADANATEVTGDVVAYIYDAKGLNAGVSLDAFSVWKSDSKRPE